MRIDTVRLPAKPPAKTSATQVRKGEKAKSWFRGDRFLQVNGLWYFTIREGRDVGPFNSHESANGGLGLFIEYLVQKQASVDHAIAVAKNGDWAVVNYQ